jgi:hypothetical protein
MSDATIGATENSVPFTVIASNSGTGDVLTLPTVTTVDDASVASITDNGDGSGVVTRADAAGGSATLTATVTNPDGTTVVVTAVVTIEAQSATAENADTAEIVFGTAS